MKNGLNDKSKADSRRTKYDRRNTAKMKPDEKLPLPLPCDVKSDDPLCSGKKSQPSDVAVYVPEKSNYSSVKLSRKYYGVSGKH